MIDHLHAAAINSADAHVDNESLATKQAEYEKQKQLKIKWSTFKNKNKNKICY